jgi:hypothetical protein
MLPVAKKEQQRSSRRVATQTTGDTFFQRLGKIVRPRRIAPIPVIKQEPDVLKNISRRSRTSKEILLSSNEIYSPFDLELPHSTSRNRTSKRSPLQDIRDQQTEGMRNLLQLLDSSPKILNHITLTKYLNRPFDLSGITEIKLYGKDLPKTPIYNKIIELLKSILQQSKNIETIEIDVPYLIPVLLELESEPRKLSTIQGIKKLILRSDYESPKPITDDYIFHLLSMIGKMNNLEELEFSKFEIDVSNFTGGITFNDLFRSIVKLEKLTRITFNGNVFTDNVKEGEFDSFVETLNKSDKQDKMSVILHWIKKNYILDDIDFRYYKWVEYLNELFLANIGNKKSRLSAESVKQLNRVNEERRGITYFNSLWLNKGNELEKWLIWLLYNDVENAYDNIVKRLCIVILYFNNDISNVIEWLNKNKPIITLDKYVLNNPSSEHKLTEHYNSIIKKIIRYSGKILIKSQGGRKAPKKMPKQPTKAPKKMPKQPTKAPKKTPKQPTKTPKQPTKPTKQPKQPKETKQPKVALKAPTKPPTVARKATKKK